MPSNHEKAFRKLRREFSRYPNLDLAEDIYLGKIGVFNSRRTTFDWRTNLNALDLHVNEVPINDELPIVQELYTSGNDISFEFSLEENNYGSVSFTFRNDFTITTQAYDLSIRAIEIENLERILIDNIRQGEIDWDLNWVIVTKVYYCSSFTLLINSSRNSTAQIITGIPIMVPGFNISDPNLNLRIARSHRMAFHTVGSKNVTPFFIIHQLKYIRRTDTYSLVRYGKF